MGERGPLPKGYTRRTNKRPAGDKRVIVERPVLPKIIVGEARAEWRRIVPELERIGLLAKVDRGVLIRYCLAWADFMEIVQQLGATGKLVKGQRSAIVRNPLWLMKTDVEANLADLERQLGLTPAARIRAGVVHEILDEDGDTQEPANLDKYREALKA